MYQAKNSSRRNEFRNEIRKSQLDQMKRQFRMGAELDFMTLSDLANWLKLPPKQYTLSQVVELRAEELQRPPLGALRIQHEDELPIEAHIRFWRFYSQQLQVDGSLWSQRIASILMAIIGRLTYQEAHYNVVYELHLLNTFQIACQKLPWEAQQRVLEWIAGPEGLRVIEVCLTNSKFFLGCLQYRNVYRVIELGLRSQLRQQNEDAAAVLAKLMRMADWDDAFDIYSHFHGLAIYLCAKIQRYAKDGCTRAFSQALALLLDVYDNAVLDYAYSGTAYSAALLVESPNEASQWQGVELLRMLTQVEDPRMVQLLLQNKDINACRLWEHLLGSRAFSKSGNTSMRQTFFSFVQNLFANSTKEQADQINNRFGGDYQDVFDLLAECLRDEDNAVVLKCALNCIKSLAFYGQREGEENALLGMLQEREIIKYMQKLCLREENQVRQLAGELLLALRSC